MRSPGVRLWIDRLLRLAASAGAPLVTGIVGVIRNKWLAMHLETSGLGILAQVTSTSTWMGTAAGLGLGLPLARAVGDAGGRGDEAAARRSLWTALSLSFAAALLLAILGLVFAPAISSAVLGSPDHAVLVRISMAGMICLALVNTLYGLFAGRSDLKGPLAFAAVGGAIAVIATLTLVPRWGLVGATIGAAIIYPAGLLGAVLIRRRDYAPLFAPPPRPIFDGREAKTLLGIAGASLFLLLSDLGVMLTLRSHYVRANGIDSNGLLQAALALSQQVGSIFYAYLSSYAFGKVTAAAAAGGVTAGLSGSVGAISLYTRRQWTPLLLLAVAVTAFSMIAATPLLHILYSSRFDPARSMMAYTLFGEFCRIAAQALAIGALPLGGARLPLAIGVTQPAALAAGYAFFCWRGADMLSLPYAYAAAGVVTLGAAIAWMGRAGVRLRARELGALIGGLALLGFIATWVAR